MSGILKRNQWLAANADVVFACMFTMGFAFTLYSLTQSWAEWGIWRWVLLISPAITLLAAVFQWIHYARRRGSGDQLED